MKELATAILGTVAVSYLVLALPATNATGTLAPNCNEPFGAQVVVGSGGGSCLLSSSTCILGTEVDLRAFGGLSGLNPSLTAGWESGSC
jgi:hypothetical protein